ncbi:PKD domain-containing protein [Shewanella algae]|uniref:PKD domain-containing protein n=1 Tax=Shewanella algae TaxID=38313 RepID=UPI000AE173CF|nr:PKD domain-containing protein [Shewanella algae]NKZ41862.1 hypothetical protein [Shewanella algae]QTE77131.1 hypothetical protein E1N14_016640 [Shewanella algae]
MNTRNSIVIGAVLLLIAGCGGSHDSEVEQEQLPIADAGQAMLLQKGATAVLNGSQSYDPGGSPLSYRWQVISKPATSTSTLSDPTSPFPSFYLDAVGNYEFELVVNNGEYDSFPDRIIVSDTVAVPSANAGPDRAASVGQDVTLDGSGSFDPDGDPLSFHWVLSRKPNGSTALLARSETPFALLTPDVDGEYEIELTVSDGSNSSAVDQVLVSTLNTRPLADAGPSLAYALGQVVTMDGTRSSDADGDPLTFKWHIVSAPGGSAATLTNADKARASIQPDVNGDYVIALVVNDGNMDSQASTLVLHSGNQPPVAHAGRDISARIGQVLHLDGSGSTDGNGDPLTPQWAIISKPKNSSVTLGDSHTFHPTFTPDVNGDYVVQLIVSDAILPSAPDSVVISTQNTAPIADAGQPMSVATGSTINLDGSRSSDAEGSALSYAWSIVTAPTGSSATLAATNIVSPEFTPDVAGDFVFQLIVNDGVLSSMPATVIVTDNDLPPTADAGKDQSVQTGVTTTLDGSQSRDPERQPLTYLWSILSSPVGSGTVLSNATSVNPTLVPDSAGDYIVQLTVTDAIGQTATDVVVLRDGSRNTLPVADAGNDAKVFLGSNIVLDGLASSDADGDPLSYKWSMLSRPAGSVVQLNNDTSASPDFTPDVEGDFVIQLVVSDGKSTSLPDVVVIHDNKKNLAPLAIISGITDGVTGQAYQLDGSQSSDPDGDPISFRWLLLSDPVNGVLNDPSSARPNFIPTSAGTYSVALSVSDGVRDSPYVTASIVIKDPAKGSAIPTPVGHNLMMLSSRGGESRTGSLITVRESDLTQATEVTSFHGLPYPIQPDVRQGWSVHPTNNKAYQLLTNGGINNTGTITEFIPSSQEASMFLSFPELEVSSHAVGDFYTELLFHPDGKSAYTYTRDGGANDAGVLIHINFDPGSADYKKISVIAEFGSPNGAYPGFNGSPTTKLYWNGAQKTELIAAFGYSRFEQRPVIKIVPKDVQDLSQPWDIKPFGDPIWSNGRYFVAEDDRQVIVTSSNDPILSENGAGGALGFTLPGCQNPFGAFFWEDPQVYVLCQGSGGADALLYASNTSVTQPALAATFRSLTGTEFGGVVASDLRAAIYSVVNDENASVFITLPSPGAYVKKPTLSEITKPNYAIRNLVTGGDELGYLFIGTPAIVTESTDNVNDRFIITTSFDGGVYGEGAIITYDRQTASIAKISLGYPTGGLPYGRILKASSGDYFFAMREFSEGNGADQSGQRAIARYDSAIGAVEIIKLGDSINPAIGLADDKQGHIYTLTSVQNGITSYYYELVRIDGTNLTSSRIASYPASNNNIPETEVVFDDNNLWFFTDESLRCHNLAANSDGELQLSGNSAHEPVHAVTFPVAGGDGFFTTRQSSVAGEGTIQRLNNNCTTPTIMTSVAGLSDQPTTALVAASDGYMYYGTKGGKLMRYDKQSNAVAEVATVPNRSIVGFIVEDSNGDLVGFASNGIERDDKMFAYRLSSTSITISDVPDDTPIDEVYPGFTEIN